MTTAHQSANFEQLVRDFHDKFRHPTPRVPTKLEPEYAAFRDRLLDSELEEYEEAKRSGDPVKIGCEAADVIFLVVGDCVARGIPIQDIFEFVAAANMCKQPHPSGRVTEKPVKPPGWRPPADDAELVIHAQRVAAVLGSFGEPLRPHRGYHSRRGSFLGWLTGRRRTKTLER